MARKEKAKALGDALDMMVPRTPEGEPKEFTGRRKKIRATFHIEEDCLNASRDTVRALCGPPLYLTLSKLVEEALWQEMERLRKKYNKGERFAAFHGKLVGGRPIGT